MLHYIYIYTHLHSVLHRQTNLCFVNKTCFASCFILSKKTCISSKKQCYKLGCISHTTKICKIKKVLHLGPLFLVTTCHHVLLQVRPIIVTSRAKSLLQVRPIIVTSRAKSLLQVRPILVTSKVLFNDALRFYSEISLAISILYVVLVPISLCVVVARCVTR